MAKQRTAAIFLALGLAAPIGACENPSADLGEGGEATNESTPTETVLPAGAEGGEGGVSSGNEDVDYMTALGLMKGHLIVANELMEQGNYEEAEPHIGHPVEELYSDVEGQLSQRNVSQFKDELNQLSDLAKSAPDSPQTEAAFESAMQSIDEAIAALPDQVQSPEFTLEVINRMLATAAAEYEAAIVDGEIVETLEYQDSRGFVLYAESLFQDVADQLEPSEREAIAANLETLKTAWPSVDPPATPVKSPSEVYGLVSEIKPSR